MNSTLVWRRILDTVFSQEATLVAVSRENRSEYDVVAGHWVPEPQGMTIRRASAAGAIFHWK